MMNKRWITSFLLLFALVILSASWWIIRFPDKPLIRSNQSVYYEFKSGTSLSQLAQDLSSQGFLRYPTLFIAYVRLKEKTGALQAGEYLFPANASTKKILQMLVKGQVIEYPFTLIEGWTFDEMMQQMQQ
jgi:UPF0755 protein